MSSINTGGSQIAQAILDKTGNLIEVTHSELVALRDSASLIPGTLYHITDYATTTTQENTRVVENVPFTVIVLALSNNKLAGKAWAYGDIVDRIVDGYSLYRCINPDDGNQTWGVILPNNPQVGDVVQGRYNFDEGTAMYLDTEGRDERHFTQVSSVNGDQITIHWYYDYGDKSGEGDDTFEFDSQFNEDVEFRSGIGAGSTNPILWEIIYSLDNIKWSAGDGKGTIIWMKDENNNEAPYDFKNIQFKRCLVDDGVPVGYYGIPGVDVANISSIDEADFIWCYTFGGETDISSKSNCHSNVITAQKSGKLNNIVMYWTDSSCMHDNIMGDESSDCTITTTNCKFEETIFGATWIDPSATYKQIGYGPLGITQLCPDVLGIADLYNPYRGSDVVLYDSVRDEQVIVPCGSLVKYPSPRYTPIGIVVIPASHTEIIYPDDSPLKGKNIMRSLKYMRCDSPDTGGGIVQETGKDWIYWGGYGTDISELQNYTGYGYIASDKFGSFKNSLCPGTAWYDSSNQIPSVFDISARGVLPNEAYYNHSTLPTSDFKGKENTQIICSKITVADWQTAASITNSYSAGNYPAAACCWRYSTPGTSQGDWYLPAMGELGYLMPFFTQHNKAVTAINNVYGVGTAIQLDSSNYYCSSSEYSSNLAFTLHMTIGTLRYDGKNHTFYVVAFCGVS